MTTQKIFLTIKGMTCASCVNRVQRALLKNPAIVEAHVNLATETGTVHYLPEAIHLEEIRAIIHKAGYETEEKKPPSEKGTSPQHLEEEEKEQKKLVRMLILSIVLTIPLFVMEMGSHLFPPFHHFLHFQLGTPFVHYVSFFLATLVQFGPGLPFHQKGIKAFWNGAPDMNSLVMVGTSAAYGYSVVTVFFAHLLPKGTAHLYFEASAVIITLILFGRYLETRARGKTSQAIQKLLHLQAQTARVLRNGEEHEIEILQVNVGDIVLVRPGEKVPLDGEIIEGSSYVDESMITGEPIPVQKQAGNEVIGGTINKNGNFRFRTTRVGSETLLAQIVKMVEEAQSTKLPIQAFVDQVTQYFVPSILGIACITFLVWFVWGPEPSLNFALVNAVAVLIVACPCAMGLATPTSIMVGTGRAAELGILFRRGDALQKLQEIKQIAFDKTGTLTQGKPTLTDIFIQNSDSEEEILQKVASLENNSEHPIAEALVESAKKRGLRLLDVRDFLAQPGYGVRGVVDNVQLYLGTRRYMQELGLEVACFQDITERLTQEGKTPIYVAKNQELVAVLAVSDPIKDTSIQTIKHLHKQGFRVVMITGDHRNTANRIAQQLGIDEVIAEVLPEGKVEAIQQLQANHNSVAFVGDGINDAPALAQADIGIAIGTGTDIAIESAEVILMSGDLSKIPTAIAISRATLRNIKQNLFWAFAYNASLIPFAAGVLYPFFQVLFSPIFAAFAMATSSVFVVANALRLRRFQAH